MSLSSREFLRCLLIASALAAALSGTAWARDFFGIVDYRPSSFVEQPTSSFFYSIGDKLRFGSAVIDEGPVLFAARKEDRGLWYVSVAPNQRKAIVVSGAKSYLVQADQPTKPLLSDAYNLMAWGSGKWMKGPAGKPVYHFPDLQWDPTSHFIYITRGTWTDRFPSHMSLIRLDVNDPSAPQEITSDTSGLGYFVVGQDAACFRRVVNRGDLIWRCVIEGVEKTPTTLLLDKVVMKDGSSISERPFVSYVSNIYETELWLVRSGFAIRRHNDRWGFFSKDRPSEPAFQFNGAVEPLKGHYSDGFLQTGSIVLPDHRYALLNLWMDNFKSGGQLLVDGLTGQYRELPQQSRAYRNLNSFNYDNVTFGLRPLDRPEFKVTGDFRPY